ncbi:MAG: WD40/YVTN/BNR-like repeat-containing protein [Acinetobacter johnsonii]
MWATEFEFAKDNFNGGILAINEDKSKALLFYIDQEKIKLVPVLNKAGEEIDRTWKEDWMRDNNQVLNRMTVEVLSGGGGNPDKLVFKEQAQTGQWWQTTDLNTIYINTYFIDYTLVNTIPEKDQIRKARRYKIFKSTDGGEHFTQLKSWPSFRQVKQVLFDETGRYGYAIGEQKTLWRTSDAGETWIQIQMPKQIIDQLNAMKFDFRIDEIFNSYHFDERTKDFYFSNLFNDQGQSYSLVYKFPWSNDSKDNRIDKYSPILTLPNLDIVDINSEGNKLYILGMVYNFEKKTYDAVDTETTFLVAAPDEKNKYQWLEKVKIGNALQLGKLYIGKDQVLYSSGFKNSNSYPYQRDIAAVSFDKGRTWQLDEEGNMIQASTFDEKSNKVFMLKGGKVSSRELTKLSSLLN